VPDAPLDLGPDAGSKEIDLPELSSERVKGIEPSSVAWKATALPLSYTRVCLPKLPRLPLSAKCFFSTLANFLCRY
jgi:hypothetical protein